MSVTASEMEERVDAILARYREDIKTSTISILQDLQDEYQYLPREALLLVAGKLKVPASRIYSVANFYTAFSLKPKGEHIIKVCMGTACHVRGAPRVLEVIENITGIRPGETDAELKFSLDTVNCLGCCALGPVMEIDEQHLGKLLPDMAADLLKEYE